MQTFINYMYKKKIDALGKRKMQKKADVADSTVLSNFKFC